MSDCPCGCGQEVPQQASSIWHMCEPYWEWFCNNPLCERHATRMRNQSGDPECSWCGRKREFIGHFVAGDSGQPNVRRMVSGKLVRYQTAASLIKRTPASMIRPFQDVT